MKYFVLLLFVIAMPSFAQASACYSALEAEADQGIRIHSELMVIGLNCQHIGARHGDNLYMDYKAFTGKNADLFSSYEQILMKFFEAQGSKNIEADLNSLRTRYANKISADSAKMRPDVFCSLYAPRIPKALEMEQTKLRQWAATIYPSHPVSYPVCGG